MPWKLPKLCAHVGCSQLTSERHCQVHKRQREQQRTAKRGTATQRGYDAEWRRIRAAILEAEPLCRMCQAVATEVDHIVPMHRGGTNHPSNLQPMCRSCHNRKAKYDAPLPAAKAFLMQERDMERRAHTVVVHIVGAPATGKSRLRDELYSELGLLPFDIVEARATQGIATGDASLEAWRELERELDVNSPCSVETSGHHGNDEVLLKGRQVLRILCRADDSVRRQRLESRVVSGYPGADEPEYVSRLLTISEPPVSADIVFDTTSNPNVAKVVEETRQWLRGRGAG